MTTSRLPPPLSGLLPDPGPPALPRRWQPLLRPVFPLLAPRGLSAVGSVSSPGCPPGSSVLCARTCVCMSMQVCAGCVHVYAHTHLCVCVTCACVCGGDGALLTRALEVRSLESRDVGGRVCGSGSGKYFWGRNPARALGDSLHLGTGRPWDSVWQWPRKPPEVRRAVSLPTVLLETGCV